MIYDNGLRIYAEKNMFQNTIGIFIEDRKNSKYASNITWDKKKEGRCYPETLHINITQAQALIDQLWDCGLRPGQGTGSAGALAATEKHLDDMRKITFNKLGIDK